MSLFEGFEFHLIPQPETKQVVPSGTATSFSGNATAWIVLVNFSGSSNSIRT